MIFGGGIFFLSVCLEGDSDALMYFYEKYGEVRHHVSFEEYAEYLEYKAERNNELRRFVLCVFLLVLGVLLLLFDLRLFDVVVGVLEKFYILV